MATEVFRNKDPLAYLSNSNPIPGILEAQRQKNRKATLQKTFRKRLNLPPNANIKTLKSLYETSKSDPFEQMTVERYNEEGNPYRESRIPSYEILSFITGKKEGKTAPSFEEVRGVFSNMGKTRIEKAQAMKEKKQKERLNFLRMLEEAGKSASGGKRKTRRNRKNKRKTVRRR
jgi:hypothetical protein